MWLQERLTDFSHAFKSFYGYGNSKRFKYSWNCSHLSGVKRFIKWLFVCSNRFKRTPLCFMALADGEIRYIRRSLGSVCRSIQPSLSSRSRRPVAVGLSSSVLSASWLGNRPSSSKIAHNMKNWPCVSWYFAMPSRYLRLIFWEALVSWKQTHRSNSLRATSVLFFRKNVISNWYVND